MKPSQKITIAKSHIGRQNNGQKLQENDYSILLD